MTAGRRYLIGLGAIVLVALALCLVLPTQERPAMAVVLGLALAVQGALGWWLVRVIGTERFLLAWVIGIGTRLGIVGLCALVVVPALELSLAPALFVLVGVLLSLLVVEAVVVVLGPAGTEAR
ncbi:MAG TPA: hypothetical protein VEK78_09000 [Gemmatimonadales bacterium]|nr:hypothetical protein [Gemmatimonadales bacterium]HYT84506.1 hypothetical protein [Gemmatimonadales bacterium]